MIDPTHRPGLQARLRRRQRQSAAPPPDAAATPHDQLVWAAKNGRLGALVAKRPRQPPAWVTADEREAERAERAERTSSPAATGKPVLEPSEPEAAPLPETELTPNEIWKAEHCQWVKRPAHTLRRHREGQCLTEYDVITGEIIGDGYIHDEEDEDDEW